MVSSLQALVGGWWSVVVLEQDAQKGFAGFAGDQFVGLGGLLDGEAVGDERGDVQAPIRQQIDDSLQVAPFGPAHVTDGIIAAALFVVWIVAPRTVGARVEKGQFFFVVNLARDVQADRPHRHDARPVTGHDARQFDRIVRRGVGADQYGIAAATAREALGGFFGLLAQHGLGAHVARQLDAPGVQIDAKHLAAGRAGNAHRQQPQQPQADNPHPLAQLHLRQAETVQGNRPQGGKSSRVEVDRLGQRGQQVARHGGILGMHGVAAAGAGHALPHLPALHPFAQGNNRTRRRISQRHGLFQAVEGCFEGG